MTSNTSHDPVPGKLAFSINETSELSGLGRDAIYSEINAGRLKSLKVGKRRLIRREALHAWLAEREAATESA